VVMSIGLGDGPTSSLVDGPEILEPLDGPKKSTL
jgi:hypothetical protein